MIEQNNWIDEIFASEWFLVEDITKVIRQAVYPEVTRIDTGGGHCAPDQGPRGRQEQGQVQVTGTPTMPGVDDPAHTGDVNLGAGSANGNSGHTPSSTNDHGLSAFMMTTASGGR